MPRSGNNNVSFGSSKISEVFFVVCFGFCATWMVLRVLFLALPSEIASVLRDYMRCQG